VSVRAVGGVGEVLASHWVCVGDHVGSEGSVVVSS